MITGIISPEREALLTLDIAGYDSGSERIEAVMDTGFSDYLTLDTPSIARLELPRTGAARAELADGSVVELEEFLVRVQWCDPWQDVTVLAAEGASLVGMSLMYGYELRVQVVDGGLVTISPLS